MLFMLLQPSWMVLVLGHALAICGCHGKLSWLFRTLLTTIDVCPPVAELAV